MKGTSRIHDSKLRFVFLIFVSAFIAIIYALAKWQFLESGEFVAMANERYREIKIPAVRGSILASDQTTLAFSEPRFDFYVWKSELTKSEEKGLQSRDEFVDKVANVLEIEGEEMENKLDSEQLWIKLGDKISVRKRDALLELVNDTNGKPLQGLRFEYVNSRAYPEGRLGGHFLGFFGYNDYGEAVGVGGLEQYWERSLRPIEGVSNSEVDSFGNAILLAKGGETEARAGVTLVTSIDKNIQAIFENKLEDGFRDYQAKSVTGLIADPKTGAILAMANFPNFDPNQYSKEQDSNIFGNLAITTPYEIGSVAKVFTLAGALDLDKVEFDEVILPQGHRGCEVITPGANPASSCSSVNIQCVCTYDKKPVSQPINIVDAIVTSDNIAFRHIGSKLTNEEFYDYLSKFGVGRVSGVDLSGESTGVLPPANSWHYSDNAVFSYGHGYQLTPLQAITGISVIANQGKRMQPYLVEKVIGSDGEVKKFEPREVMSVVDPKVADRMGKMMHSVFRNNVPEARYQPLLDYNIAMKSGTALIPYKDKPGYSTDINATYVGFDNSPAKTFIMLIKLEDPKVGDLSFYNARILWLDTFIAIKDYLAVPKDITK